MLAPIAVEILLKSKPIFSWDLVATVGAHKIP